MFSAKEEAKEFECAFRAMVHSNGINYLFVLLQETIEIWTIPIRGNCQIQVFNFPKGKCVQHSAFSLKAEDCNQRALIFRVLTGMHQP